MQMLRGTDNIVQLFDAFKDDSEYCIAMELCEGGELYDHVVKRGRREDAIAARSRGMSIMQAAVNLIAYMLLQLPGVRLAPNPNPTHPIPEP